MDSENIKNKIMNREDIQEDFRKQTGQPIIKLNKCEVGTNPEYVIWLERRILALSIGGVSNRRELLVDFINECNKYRTTMEEITPEEIDKFLDN